MSTALYLAYGSNLHPLRLQDRLPDSRFLALAAIQGYELCFHKHGGDNSGKCDLAKATETDVAYGALYQLQTEDLVALDHWEGGYERQQWLLNWQGQAQAVYTYIARPDKVTRNIRPFSWYQQLVLKGSEFCGFPDHYLARIRSHDHQTDPDIERHQAHQKLLNAIDRHNSSFAEPPQRPWVTLTRQG